MLYEILASVTHNPHYLNKYITFITNCQEKNKNYKGYTEKHHICPKAQDMFPEFTSFTEFPWNCVELTPRQHYIAHLLLYKSYPHVLSQKTALYLMANLKDREVNSKLYNKLRFEVVEVSKSKVTVRDSDGNISLVDKNDPLYLSGKLLHICIGKVPVKDTLGNTFQVDTDDPRYIAGELVHIRKGTIARNRALTIEQVIEIRQALKNPTSIITSIFISKLVKPSQKDKVGKVPIEKLMYRNNRYLSYRTLIATYYADKYGITRTNVTEVIDNKTYKEVIV